MAVRAANALVGVLVPLALRHWESIWLASNVFCAGSFINLVAFIASTGRLKCWARDLVLLRNIVLRDSP